MKKKNLLAGLLSLSFIGTAVLATSSCDFLFNTAPEQHTHTFDAWEEHTSGQTTCENRLFFRTCTTCHEIEWKQGSYNDHIWQIITTDPTCTERGFDTKTCVFCGKIEVVNYVDTKHAWQERYSFDDLQHWIDCDKCDEYKDKGEHTIEDSGECSVCKELVRATKDVLYSISADGTYAEVVGYEGTATKIRIADTYQDLPVKTICDNAFDNNDKITFVIIPDSITSIGAGAFEGCASLTGVVIPNSVTSIGDSAFERCASLTSVVIPDSVISIGARAFSRCDRLTSVEIGNSVTSIGDYAFYNCDRLTSIKIQNSVTSIGISSFYNCSRLTRIVIPTSVTSIGNYAFSSCDKLTIYCEAESKPSGWSDSWNSSNRPVVWGHNEELS